MTADDFISRIVVATNTPPYDSMADDHPEP
jgi:hypothetical protein